MLHLELSLSSLASLPEDMERKLTRLRNLSEEGAEVLRQADAAADAFLRECSSMSEDRKKEEMDAIRALFAKAKEHADARVRAAVSTYELVDSHIRRMDADIARFEADVGERREQKLAAEELKEEDDIDDEDADDKDAAKAKKKKKSGKAKEAAKKKGSGAEKKNTGAKAKSKKTPATGTGMDSQASTPKSAFDMPVDPNEPTYCTCQQVSYGQMIGCDNPDCTIEWFHFGCVGITAKPRGKWFCQRCTSLKKKK